MSALPIAASLDIKAASSANSIAIGYVKNPDDSFEFVGPLVADIEKFFGLNLVDELTFFGPTAKAGEIFEIPVSATDSPTDRIFLVAIGDQSGSALRAAGASVGRKVRDKNSTVYSACAVKEVKAHAISMALGAWVWNLKTDKNKVIGWKQREKSCRRCCCHCASHVPRSRFDSYPCKY
jgi:leucyl aminopeptidase